MAKNLGFKYNELLDRDVNDLLTEHVHSDDLSLVKEQAKKIETSTKEGFKWKSQIRVITKTEKIRWNEISLQSIKYQQIPAILVTLVDITKQKRGDQEYERLLQRLIQANTALYEREKELHDVNTELRDFAHIVAHDLKAPLRGIKSLIDLLSADYMDKLNANGKELLSLLSGRVKTMHDLIHGILEYSRIGRDKEEQVEINLKDLLSEVIDLLGSPDNIEIQIAQDLPFLVGGRTRLFQIFQNLLSNAVKFMDKPKGLIRVHCEDIEEYWKFSVIDNGPGIEEKHYEKIFQIFQTLTPKGQQESTGIGLTMVRKIVQSYGGRIWVDSKVGEGSTFYFTFPKQS